MAVDPISIGLGAIQGLTSLGGLLGASAARRRAEAARDKAINDLSGQLDADYNNLVQNDRFSLLGATGQGGDAIQSLGRNLGSSLAGAGVYNSSATAGALQQATGQQQAALGGLAAQNFANEQGQLNSGRRYLTGLKLNLANSQYGEANDNLNSSRSGLASFLGSLGQFNLAQSGANQNQNALGRNAGGYGGLSPLAPGAGTGNGIDNSSSLYNGQGVSFGGANSGGAQGTFNPQAFTPGIAQGPRFSGDTRLTLLGQVHQKTLQRQPGY